MRAFCSAHGIDCDLDVSAGAVFETDRHGKARRDLAVDLIIVALHCNALRCVALCYVTLRYVTHSFVVFGCIIIG